MTEAAGSVPTNLAGSVMVCGSAARCAPNRLNPPRQARMGRVALEFRLPSPRHPRERMELRQGANKRLWITGERDGAQIALCFVFLSMLQLKHQPGQDDNWPDQKDKSRQSGAQDACTGDNSTPAPMSTHAAMVRLPETARVVVLEVRQLVRQDGGHFVLVQTSDQRVGDDDRRRSNRWQRDRIGEDATAQVHLIELDVGQTTTRPQL